MEINLLLKKILQINNNNYRPIAIATIVAKPFESLILYTGEKFLYTCHHQFGLQPKPSTELCICTLKDTFIDCDNWCSTAVFVTFLDASKIK